MGTTPVIFNYANWTALFPNLASVSEPQATLYFYNFAQLYVRNDGRGPVNDPLMQEGLLNLTTAHIATLLSPTVNGVPTTGGSTPPSPLVGRIANATEGTVSVQTEMPDQSPNAAWWNQTPYGAAVWVALKPFRTFRYIPPVRRRFYRPFFPSGGFAPPPPPPPTNTYLTNVGGWLNVAPEAGWPNDASTPGALYSNGLPGGFGVVSVIPGGTPDPSAPPVYFGSITAAALLALGGDALPLSPLAFGTGQLYNQDGIVTVA